jgi:putative aldouronate transport system permease protein
MRLKRLTKSDKVFIAFSYIFVFFVICATLYPFLYVVSSSLSDPVIVGKGEVWLFPKGITLDAYKAVLKDPQIWKGYYNTIWYVTVGTIINIVMTTLTAYPLSRRHFDGRNAIMMFIAFTMFFSGGMVPGYLLVKNLHLINSRWAIVIPAAIGTYNLIVMRTFFQSIPDSLHEAATIDGCSEFGIFTRIYLPLSKASIAVLVLFYAVGHWNSFFSAMMYLNNEEKYPLQMILRKILIQQDQGNMMTDVVQGRDLLSQTIRYATIIVSVLPIITAYPFLQKYFVKGVMIGAIKG